MKDKKAKLIVLSIFLIVLIGALVAILLIEKDSDNKDALKFSKEYTLVNEDNIFVYRDIDEIINILENGTGIVYLGFPECKWCQNYVPMLNEVAKEEGLEKIYYYNIKEDRANNTEKYQRIVEILNDNLLFDEEGKHRIYVPDVTAVLKGKIVGHNNETSVVSGDITPEEYWTIENKNKLKSDLRKMILEVKEEICTSCN